MNRRASPATRSGPGAPRRVLVADFDSVRQRTAWSADPDDAGRRLDAVLRLAWLLEGRILLTDAQLLDGAYFLHRGPAGIARVLGCDPRRLPFLVAVAESAGSLSASLEMKRADPGFEWSSAAAADVDADDLQRLDAARDEWARFVDGDGADRVAFQPFGFEVIDEEWQRGDPPSSLETLGLDGIVGRSAAHRRLLDLGDDAAENVSARWDSAYLRAIAVSNRATWLSCSEPASPASDRDRGFLRLRGGLLESLAGIEPTVLVVAAHAARDAVAQWRAAPDRRPGSDHRALNEVAWAVGEALSPVASRRVTWWGAITRFLAPVLLSAFVLLFTLNDRVHGLAVIIAVMGFLAAVPFGEIYILIHARRGRADALIRVHSA